MLIKNHFQIAINNVLLYFLLKYLFAGTLKYKPFVNLSIILLLFISYKGIKINIKMDISFLSGDFGMP